jgi:hypothetical protein
MRSSLRTCTFVLLLLTPAAFAPRLHAQWLGTVAVDQGYNSNAFGLSGGGAASLSALTLAYGYFPTDAQWSADYSGMIALIPQFPDQQYMMHALSFDWETASDTARDWMLSTGAMLTGRFGRETWTLYDFWQGGLTTTWKFAARENLTLRATLAGRVRAYPNLRTLGYGEYTPSVGASLMFESRTSLHAELFGGQKHYLQSGGRQSSLAGMSFTTEAGTTLIVDDEGMVRTSTAAGAGMSVEGGGPGEGGGGNGNGGGSGSGGSGSGGSGSGDTGGGTAGGGNGGGGYGGGLRAGADAMAPILAYDVPALATGGLRFSIAQGLTEQVGISLRYQKRWNLSGDIRAMVAGMLIAGGDEDLIDDPYSYGSDELAFVLTSMLPWSMTVRATGFVHDKHYAYAASLDDASGGPDRSDLRMGAALAIEQTLAGSWLGFSDPMLTFTYQYARNESNTPVFDYHQHAVSLGLELAW